MNVLNSQKPQLKKEKINKENLLIKKRKKLKKQVIVQLKIRLTQKGNAS